MRIEDGIRARDNGGHMHANTAKASLTKGKDKTRCAEKQSRGHTALEREKQGLHFLTLALHEAWLFGELPPHLSYKPLFA